MDAGVAHHAGPVNAGTNPCSALGNNNDNTKNRGDAGGSRHARESDAIAEHWREMVGSSARFLRWECATLVMTCDGMARRS